MASWETWELVRHPTPVLERNCQTAEPHEPLMRVIEMGWMWATCPHNEGREWLGSSLWSWWAGFSSRGRSSGLPAVLLADLKLYVKVPERERESPAGSSPAFVRNIHSLLDVYAEMQDVLRWISLVKWALQFREPRPRESLRPSDVCE